MAVNSARRRVLDIVTAHMRTQLDGVARSVEQDLRGYTQVGTAGCPALFVVTSEGSVGSTEHLPGQEVREMMGFDLCGYAVSPTGQIDGVMNARELFLEQTVRALYALDSNGDEILLKALIADAIVNNSGAVDLRHSAPPETDGGFVPPFGVFRLPCVALLHYKRSDF